MTSALAPPTAVAAPTRLPLPYGLFSVVSPLSDQQRWHSGGAHWQSISCQPLGGVGPLLCPKGETVGDTKTLDVAGPITSTASAFTVYGHDSCNAIANSAAAAVERAVEHLESREQQAVEQALWTGDLGNTPNFAAANGYPALSSIGTATPDELDDAVAQLEAAFAAAYGSLGVLHMSRRWAAQLSGTTERGGRLYSKLGTPIVAGAGYDADKIVATSQLVAFRSEIFPGDAGVAVLDTDTNTQTAIAERTYLVGFDACGATEITIAESED